MIVLYVIDANGWLESYDPDGGDLAVAYPTGTYGVTSNLDKARRFDGVKEALEFWKQPSTRTPLRPDGQPNRPLTSRSVMVQTVEHARSGQHRYGQEVES